MGFFGLPRIFRKPSLRNDKGNNRTNSTPSRISSNSSATMHGTAFTSPSDANHSTAPVPQHRYEGGRRFLNNENVDYLLADDTEEDDRMHLQHWAVKLAFGSNFDAPIQQVLESGANVLDSACGPGTWTLEMAKEFPNSQFYGTDISSRFPDQIKPRNCDFCIHNVLDDPPFEENYFDYIHQRLVILGIKAVDWPKLLQHLKLTLKPGGWIELTEFSSNKFKDIHPNLKLGSELSLKLMNGAGFDSDLGTNLPKLLSDAGFTNIQARPLDVPINHSGKVGELFWQDFKEALTGARTIYTKMHPEFQEPGVYDKFIKGLGEECKETKRTMPWTRVIAQKPLTSDI